jgi:O-antigen/teichoic acid export membrane protein
VLGMSERLGTIDSVNPLPDRTYQRCVDRLLSGRVTGAGATAPGALNARSTIKAEYLGVQDGAEEPAITNRGRTSNILRTGVALLSVQGLTWVSSLLGILVVPRFLGAGDFGLLATAATTIAVGVMLAGFGTTNYLIKESARSPEKVRELVINAVAWRLIVWLFLCVLATPALFLLVDSATLTTLLIVAAMAGTFGIVQSGLLAGLQGIESLGRTALAVSVVVVLGNGVTAVLLLAGGDVVAVAALNACIAGGSLFVSSVAFWRLTHGTARPSWRLTRDIAFAGPPYLAWDLGLMLYGTIDLVILALLVDSDAVGSYALAYRLVGIPIFATTIITMAVFPSLSASAVNNEEWFRRVVSQATRLAFLVTAPMAIGMAVLAGGIVDLLAGPGFGSAPVLVAILALHIPPAAVHTVLGMALFARDRQKRMAVLAWSAALFNVAANLIAIPVAERTWGNGAIGAGVVTIATEGVIGFMVWRWAWDFIDRTAIFSGLARVAGSTASMAVVVIAVNVSLGFWPAVAAGLGGYLAASLLFGSISVGELRHITSQFASRRGRLVPSES